MPGVGQVDQVLDPGRQLVGHDIGEGDGVQDRPLGRPQRHPHLLEVLCGPRVIEVLRSRAADLGEGAADRPDHLSQRDGRCGTTQRPPALGAAAGAHDIRPTHLGEDVAEVAGGDPLQAGEFLRGEGCSGCGREFEGRSKGVVRPARDAHGVSIGAAVAAGRFRRRARRLRCSVRLTDLRHRLDSVLGPAYAASWSADMVIEGLGGRTVDQAVAAGIDTKDIWRAVCEVIDVPGWLR